MYDGDGPSVSHQCGQWRRLTLVQSTLIIFNIVRTGTPKNRCAPHKGVCNWTWSWHQKRPFRTIYETPIRVYRRSRGALSAEINHLWQCRHGQKFQLVIAPITYKPLHIYYASCIHTFTYIRISARYIRSLFQRKSRYDSADSNYYELYSRTRVTKRYPFLFTFFSFHFPLTNSPISTYQLVKRSTALLTVGNVSQITYRTNLITSRHSHLAQPRIHRRFLIIIYFSLLNQFC